MSVFHVVIPARYQSTRLPAKPLAKIAGIPMIVRVADRASASGAASVVVATDDTRIVDVVENAGYRARLTRTDHASGSDRIVEVADALGWADDAIVVNVQGDEPLIPPAVIDQVAAAFNPETGSSPQVQLVTLCEPLTEPTVLFDANVVKVVFDINGRALYFSRAPIPFDRAKFSSTGYSSQGALTVPCWWRHIGIYGYRVGVLRKFVQEPVAAIERLESLEQLRFMHMGVPIQVYPACAPVPGGVDTPADLAALNQLLANAEASAQNP